MQILLLTDTHLAESAAPLIANWDSVAAYAARGDVEVTVHLGDLTLDGALTPGQLDAARQRVAEWPTPMRIVPGNHDIGDAPAADAPALAHYRALFGPDYWALDVDDWRVVALDSQLLGTRTADEATQRAWLAARIDERPDACFALLLHHPLFDRVPDEAVPGGRYVAVEPRTDLLALLSRVDLRLVCSGHTHQYRDRSMGGVRHLWIPSAAFVIPDSHQQRAGEKVVGVGLLELRGRDSRFDLVVPEGLVRHDIVELGLYADRKADRS